MQTPGPWRVCRDGECPCMAVWGENHPVARVIVGDWGDDYPSIRVVGASLDLKAEAYMEQITYGHIPEEIAIANAHLIAAAVNACFKVNPENPMAVAENLDELVQISERLVEGSSLTPANGEGNLILRMRYQSFQDLCTTLAALGKGKGE